MWIARHRRVLVAAAVLGVAATASEISVRIWAVMSGRVRTKSSSRPRSCSHCGQGGSVPCPEHKGIEEQVPGIPLCAWHRPCGPCWI